MRNAGYAMELSADETLMTGAVDVQFSRPMPYYVENFLGFPTGMAVPVGYYDRQRGQWIPSENGRVIEILGVSGGKADLDTDGDGLADEASALGLLGITEAEQQQLAGLYTSGETLWRVPISHFTPWDCNWPYSPPADARAIDVDEPETVEPVEDPCQQNGSSTISCQNQVLGEDVLITGTPFHLHYQSDRVQGRKAAFEYEIPLSGPEVSPSLDRIELEINVSGQLTQETFPAAPNLAKVFTWDGKDAYGRPSEGGRVEIEIKHVYPAVYQEPADSQQSFAQFSGIPMTGNRSREEISFLREISGPIGAFVPRGVGLGAWSVDIHHSYDPNTSTLHFGDGSRRSAEKIGPVSKRMAGDGGIRIPPEYGDGGGSA